MITNLLSSIAKAWIKAEQAREEDKREEIVNYIIRDIINEGCGLRIGSIIDYNPNQKQSRKYSTPSEEFIPLRKIGIVTKMTVTYRPIAISVDTEEGVIPKEINVGMLQLRIHVPTDDCSNCGKGDYIINIDEFNLNNDDINYVCNNALTLL
uniref:Uncharacterized protein n=1 Tax=CrAss-like virus sp. ctXt06 TaxID=2825837 RepID=A0A8S5V6U2_9CAUD|nr:MAG TPA: hypothetical protein [CrAss-like virus sp. ctXt06]